jgi:hypothetical protein
MRGGSISARTSLRTNESFGNGGDARGGGLFNAFGRTGTISHTTIIDNTAFGGTGGVGGTGGGLGGGVLNGRVSDLTGAPSVLTFDQSMIAGNQAIGGTGGCGGNGGNGKGGSLYVLSGSTITLTSVQVRGNQATGGAAGQAGQGAGGGVYVQSGATVFADALTIISGNHASTSDDDVFGVIMDI